MEKKRIFTAYYGNRKTWEVEHSRKVIISVTAPVGFPSNRMIAELTPPEDLVSRYKKGKVTEDEYRKEYRAHVLSFNKEDIWDKLQDGDIMYCWEGKLKFCHRHEAAIILKELFGDRIEIREW